MDTAQILLLVVVIVLTFLLLILGIQVFFILKEFKDTIAKLNKVLDDAGVISESVSTPIASLSTIVTGVKTGMSLASLFRKKKKAHSTGREREREDENGEE
jgi:ABC-type sulfate transport system permease component